jgi:5-(carboxyamino)imidazole ribonucleotide mutase
MREAPPLVGIIMGSKNDWETMQHSAETLDQLRIGFEKRVISAHRRPDDMFEYAETASRRGIEVIIAGAGGAAHLPGMTASKAKGVPVFGVPIVSTTLNGIDALLSIAQMPAGCPVYTMAIGKPGAINAALGAADILSKTDRNLKRRVARFRARLLRASEQSDRKLQEET